MSSKSTQMRGRKCMLQIIKQNKNSLTFQTVFVVVVVIVEIYLFFSFDNISKTRNASVLTYNMTYKKEREKKTTTS
jgi:hypothetical protein